MKEKTCDTCWRDGPGDDHLRCCPTTRRFPHWTPLSCPIGTDFISVGYSRVVDIISIFIHGRFVNRPSEAFVVLLQSTAMRFSGVIRGLSRVRRTYNRHFIQRVGPEPVPVQMTAHKLVELMRRHHDV